MAFLPILAEGAAEFGPELVEGASILGETLEGEAAELFGEQGATESGASRNAFDQIFGRKARVVAGAGTGTMIQAAAVKQKKRERKESLDATKFVEVGEETVPSEPSKASKPSKSSKPSKPPNPVLTEEDKIHDQQAAGTPNQLPHNRAEHIGGSHYEPVASKHNISVYVNPKRKRTVISYGEPETSMYDNVNEMRRQFLSSQADTVYNYLNQEADYLHDHTFIHQGTGKVSEGVASKYSKRKIG